MHPYLAKLKIREGLGTIRRQVNMGEAQAAVEVGTEIYEIALADLNVGDAEYVLAAAYLGAARLNARDNAGAQDLLSKAAGRADRALAGEAEERQILFNNLAIAHGRLGRFKDMISRMQQAIEEKAKRLGEDALDLLGNLNDLASAYCEADRFGEAEPTIRHILKIIEHERGRQSRDYVEMLGNLQGSLQAAGRDAEAAEVARQIRKFRSTPGNREKLARQAKAAYLAGNLDEAKRLHRALLAGTPRLPLPNAFTQVIGDVFDPLQNLAAEIDRQGVAAEERGDWPQAIQAYCAVIAIFEVSSDDYGINRAKGMSNLALAHQKSGDLKQARVWFEASARLLGPVLHSEHFEKLIENIVGYFRLLCDHDAPDPATDLEAAMNKLSEATAQRGANYGRSLRMRFPVVDPQADAVEGFRLWMEARIAFYRSWGAIEIARQLHQHVLDCHEILFDRDERRILEPLVDFASFCIDQGPIETTRALLDRGATLAARIADRQPADLIPLLRSEARFLTSLADHAGADQVLKNALQELEQAPNPSTRRVLESDRLTVWLRMGKQGPEVDTLLDATIEEMQGALNQDDSAEMRQLADLLSYRRRWPESETLYRRALALQEERFGESDPRTALTLSNLGTACRFTGRFDEASDCYERVIKTRVGEFGIHHQSVAQARVRRALSLAGAKRWEEASQEARRVLEANEAFLQSAASVTSREQLFSVLQSERSAVNVFISIALQLPDRQQAALEIYQAVLRRKGLAFEALLARRSALLMERFPQQAGEIAELDAISATLSSQLVSRRLSDADIQEGWRRKRELEAHLASMIPEMASAMRAQLASAERLREALDAESTLIEFVRITPSNFEGLIAEGAPEYAPPRYLGLVLRRDAGLALVDLGVADLIETQVAAFGRGLAGESNDLAQFAHEEPLRVDVSEQSLTALRSCGEQLRALIWDPLKVLNGPAPRPVFVAADGALGLLPLELLPQHPDRLLMDHFVFSYLRSGRDLLTCEERPPHPGGAPVLFCGPDFDAVSASEGDFGRNAQPAALDITWSRAADDLGLAAAAPLAGALKEGQRIRELLGWGTLYQGSEATEPTLRSVDSPIILHLATHGFLRPPSLKEQGEFESREALFDSGLLLAGFNAVLRGRLVDPSIGNALLTGEDAVTLHLQGTEMVVLSACRSGLGAAIAGEGVLGLHRAFAAAGAATVVLSLWKVPDQQTGELMTLFYQNLIAGKSRAVALREAKQTLRRQFAHPFFWGSFICHGDWRPIERLAVA